MLKARELYRRGFRFFYTARSFLQFNKSGADDEHDTENIQQAGNLPGGGLGKIQNTREEVYFCQQQHELIQKLIEKFKNPDTMENMTEEEKEKGMKMIDEYLTKCVHNQAGRSVDVLEEGYFYNEQFDDMKILRKKELDKSSTHDFPES